MSRRTNRRPLLVAVAVTVLAGLLLTGGLNPIHNPPRSTAVSLGRDDASSELTPDDSAIAPPSVTPNVAFSANSAGQVARTIFLNYNANVSGNFPSAVWNWQVGAPAIDPASGDIWIPTLAITRDNVSTPSSGPTIVYNPATNQSRLVWSLQNSTAFVIDPRNELLFATQPNNGSVAVFDLSTETWVGPSISVGGRPVGLAYDSGNQTVFVTSSSPNTTTVLSATSLRVVISGLALAGTPTAMLSDVRDQRIYVAIASSPVLQVINSSSYAFETSVSLVSPATALGFANTTDRVAVAMSASPYLAILLGSTGGTASTVAVGRGMVTVAANANGSEFALGDNSGANLTIVNSTTISPHTISVPVPLIPQRLEAIPGNDSLFVWSNRTRQVGVTNLSSNSSSPSSPDLGVRAGSLAYASAVNTVVVSDRTNASLLFLNATTLVPTRQPLPLPGLPESVEVSPTGAAAYVGYFGGVEEVDAITGAVIAQNNDLPENNSDLLAIGVDGLLWDLNNLSGVIALNLSTLNGVVETGLDVGQINIHGFAYDNQTNNLYVVDTEDGSVAVLNASTGVPDLPAVAPIPHAVSVAYDPVDELVYVAGYAVYVVEPSTSAVIAGPIGIGAVVGATSISFDPSRSFLYVTTSGVAPSYNGNVTVLDGNSLSASQSSSVTIPVGKFPLLAISVDLPGATSPGSAEIWVVNDASGTVSVIASPPQITFFAASPNPVDVNVPTQLLVGLSGGAGASSVVYTGLPTPCQSQNTMALSCQPNTKGTYNVTAAVTDSLGFTTSALAPLSVSPAVKVHLHLGPAPYQVDLGYAFNGSATVSGGTGPYSFSWNYGDGSTSSGSSISHTYGAVGTFAITATVSDSGGGFSSASAFVSVVPLPAATISASPTNMTDIGVPITFNATLSGGTTPGTVQWSFGTGATGNTTSYSYAYPKPGVYFVSFVYTDASHHNTTRSLTVTVNHALGASVRSNAGSATASTGTAVAFNATITGGTAPFTVLWSFDDGSYATGIAAQHAFAVAGTYAVTMLVVDAVGAQKNVTYTLTITTATVGGIFHGDSGLALFLGFVGGIVVGALLLYLLTRRRRAPPSSPPKPFQAPASSGPSSPAPSAAAPAPAAGDEWKEE